MTTFASSDGHWGHGGADGRGGIIKWREGYDHVDEMNEDLVERWNKVVSPDDTVLYLGDAVMGQRDDTLKWVGRLNGNIILTPGNHDHVHPMHLRKKSQEWGYKWTAMYLEAGFSSIGPEYFTSIVNSDTRVGFCHFPFSGDHTDEERYTSWRPTWLEDQIDVLVHGHVHDLWKTKDHITADGRVIPQLNVGVDKHDFAPIALEELLT